LRPQLTRCAARAPLQATAALVDSVLADIGQLELEEWAEKRRLELTGTNLA
jgi:hypothetical protein